MSKYHYSVCTPSGRRQAPPVFSLSSSASWLILISLVPGSCWGSRIEAVKARSNGWGLPLSFWLKEQNPSRSFLTNVSLCCISRNWIVCPSLNQSTSIEKVITMLGLGSHGSSPSTGEGALTLDKILQSPWRRETVQEIAIGRWNVQALFTGRRAKEGRVQTQIAFQSFKLE